MTQQRPNILFLLNDHQAYYGHGAMAGGPPVRRPHFDRLAAGGVEFQRAYSVSPLCGPARRSMLTGLFPHNHGETGNDANRPFDRDTYLQLLARGGYRNYYYGKWHAGPGTAHDFCAEGFSYPSYNNPYTKPEYKRYLAEQGLPEPEIEILHSFHPWGKQAGALAAALETGKPYIQDGEWCNEHAAGILRTPKETHESFFLSHLACGKLRELAAAGGAEPFHLRVDFWGPHQPYFPTREYADTYPPASIPVYPSFHDDLSGKPDLYKAEHNLHISREGRLIQPNPLPWSAWQTILSMCYAQTTLMDEAAGRILQTLEETGLAENTLVVWSTDHGDGVACHGGHFDKDAFLPEEILRIPLAVRWPGRIPAGQKTEALASNVDIPVTLLDAAGLAFAGTVDGCSLLPRCEDPGAPWREDLMSESHGHFGHRICRVLLWGNFKYVYNQGDLDELYDLEKDPFELRNLAAEASCAGLLGEMQARLRVWQERTGDSQALLTGPGGGAEG